MASTKLRHLWLLILQSSLFEMPIVIVVVVVAWLVLPLLALERVLALFSNDPAWSVSHGAWPP